MPPEAWVTVELDPAQTLCEPNNLYEGLGIMLGRAGRNRDPVFDIGLKRGDGHCPSFFGDLRQFSRGFRDAVGQDTPAIKIVRILAAY